MRNSEVPHHAPKVGRRLHLITGWALLIAATGIFIDAWASWALEWRMTSRTYKSALREAQAESTTGAFILFGMKHADKSERLRRSRVDWDQVTVGDTLAIQSGDEGEL